MFCEKTLFDITHKIRKMNRLKRMTFRGLIDNAYLQHVIRYKMTNRITSEANSGHAGTRPTRLNVPDMYARSMSSYTIKSKLTYL